jgi:hypothetical protein
MTAFAALVAVAGGLTLAAGLVGFILAAGLFGSEGATGASRAFALAASTLLISGPVVMGRGSTDSRRPRKSSQTASQDQICGSCGHCFNSLDDLIDHQTARRTCGKASTSP